MKIVAGFLLVAVLLAVSGTTYQFVVARSDRIAFPPPGQMIEVDGFNLHLDCRGKGSPTLILEAGLTSGSTSWLKVFDQLATTTRVCAYDRPGLDWSEPIGRSVSSTEVAQRLHKLLASAGIEGQIILLGMSAGGVYVRNYFAQYPDDVVGMVLVDSSHEQQGHRLPDVGDEDAFATTLNLCRALQPFGVVRLLGSMRDFLSRYELSPDQEAPLLANMNQSHNCDALYWESKGFPAEVNWEEAPASLGDLPLLVLSQGAPPAAEPAFGLTHDDAIAQREVWNVLQLELTALSSRGERKIALESGHVIQLDQPEFLIQNVNEFLKVQQGPFSSH